MLLSRGSAINAIDEDELRELVFDAWRMVVPKKLSVLSDDEVQQRCTPAPITPATGLSAA